MGSLIGCFVVSKDGRLYRVTDIWKGDKKASAEVCLEHISDEDEPEFRWKNASVLDRMEVVKGDALEG